MNYDNTSTYKNSNKKSPLFLSVINQIRTKYEKAKEDGDEETCKKLETYYKDSKVEDFFIENPSKGKDGKKRFCFINRKKGFINIDEELTEDNLELLDILKALNVSFYQLTDEESYNKFQQELYSFDYNQFGAIIVQFPDIDGDKLFITNSRDYLDEERFGNYFLNLGFEKVEIGRYYNQINDDKSEGEIKLTAFNMKNPGSLFPIRTDYVKAKLKIGPSRLTINVDDSRPYDTKYIVESKEYKSKCQVEIPYYLTINGEKITDLSKVKFTDNDTSDPVEYVDLGDGVFNLKITPKSNDDIFNGYGSNAPVTITYNSGQPDETSITTYMNVNQIYDPERIQFTIDGVTYSDGHTTVNFTVKDLYNPSKNISCSEIFMYIKGYCETATGSITNGSGTVIFTTIPELADYEVLFATNRYSNGRTAFAKFTK